MSILEPSRITLSLFTDEESEPDAWHARGKGQKLAQPGPEPRTLALCATALYPTHLGNSSIYAVLLPQDTRTSADSHKCTSKGLFLFTHAHRKQRCTDTNKLQRAACLRTRGQWLWDPGLFRPQPEWAPSRCVCYLHSTFKSNGELNLCSHTELPHSWTVLISTDFKNLNLLGTTQKVANKYDTNME